MSRGWEASISMGSSAYSVPCATTPGAEVVDALLACLILPPPPHTAQILTVTLAIVQAPLQGINKKEKD